MRTAGIMRGIVIAVVSLKKYEVMPSLIGSAGAGACPRMPGMSVSLMQPDGSSPVAWAPPRFRGSRTDDVPGKA